MDNAAQTKFVATGDVFGTMQADGKIIWQLGKASAIQHAKLFGLRAVQVEYNRNGDARVRDLASRKLINVATIEYVG